MNSIDEILSDVLKTQLKTYPASSVTIISSGDVSEMVPVDKYDSVCVFDVSRQPVYIPKLRQSDLLVVNLLLEKMGCDFFINMIKKVHPQFICCSFYMDNELNISKEILSARLMEFSYDLFSHNEFSLSNGKTLVQLDFIISTPSLGVKEPVKSSYKVSRQELMSLSVYNVGYQKCEPLYQWGPGIRDHYLIHYVVSGKGTYVCRGVKIALSAGDCFLCYPDTEIFYCADEQEPWEYAWIGFNGPDAALVLGATDFTPDSPFLQSVENGNAVLEKILGIYDARGNGFSNTVRMTGMLYEFLSLFVRNSTRGPVLSSAQIYVQGAVQYISENYSYPITVENISSYVGISRSQLFRCFDSVMGLSPKEYLTQYRIKQACHFLESTSYSITAIANSLGFDSSLYFSKAFHKAVGMSPSEYRERNLKKDKQGVVKM